jgi:hypothetical protein
MNKKEVEKDKYKVIPFKDYKGYLFIGDHIFDANCSLEDFKAELNTNCNYDSLPRVVYAAEELRINFDPNLMIEDALEFHPEEAIDRIDPTEISALNKTLHEWANRQGVISFVPDLYTIILFPTSENDFKVVAHPGTVTESYNIEFDDTFANITLNNEWSTLTLYSEHFEKALFFPDDRLNFKYYLRNQDLGDILSLFVGDKRGDRIHEISYLVRIWQIFMQVLGTE